MKLSSVQRLGRMKIKKVRYSINEELNKTKKLNSIYNNFSTSNINQIRIKNNNYSSFNENNRYVKKEKIHLVNNKKKSAKYDINQINMLSISKNRFNILPMISLPSNQKLLNLYLCNNQKKYKLLYKKIQPNSVDTAYAKKTKDEGNNTNFRLKKSLTKVNLNDNLNEIKSTNIGLINNHFNKISYSLNKSNQGNNALNSTQYNIFPNNKSLNSNTNINSKTLKRSSTHFSFQLDSSNQVNLDDKDGILSAVSVKNIKNFSLYNSIINNYSNHFLLPLNKDKDYSNKILVQILKKKNINKTISLSPPAEEKQIIELPKKSNIKKKYYVLQCRNNNKLLEELILLRKNWSKKPNNKAENEFDLKICDNSKGICGFLFKESNHMRMINHFEYEKEMCNKARLFINLYNYCDILKINVFNYIPLTILFDICNSYDYEEGIKEFNSFIKKINTIKNKKNFNDKYSSVFVSSYKYLTNKNNTNRIILYDTCYRKTNSANNYLWIIKPINLFQGKGIEVFDTNDEDNYIKIIRKFKFWENVNNKNSVCALNNNNNITSTNNSMDKEIDKDKDVIFKYSSIYTSLNSTLRNNNCFPLKNNNKTINLGHNFPLINSNSTTIIRNNFFKNTNINNFNNINNINNSCSKLKNNKYKSSICIVQKYIEKPLLYKEKKFDIRMWILITHNLSLYLFKEGHMKTSSLKYDLNNKNKLIHITNYSVQKYCDNFGEDYEGNEICFTELKKLLGNDEKLFVNIINQMKNIIKLTFNSVKNKINQNKLMHCFCIMGYDFMIDTNFKVWLIEINKNPGFNFSSTLMKIYIPRMLNDALKLTFDVVFHNKFIKETVFHVDNYDDNENMFELLQE